jgi:hypothetical protein
MEDNITFNQKEKGMLGRGMDWFDTRSEQVADSCDRSNEPLGYTKGGKFLD